MTLVMKGCILGLTSAAFSRGCILDARLPWQILPHKSTSLTKKILTLSSYFFSCMISAQQVSVTVGVELSRGAALVAKSCGSAAGGDGADVGVALGLPPFSLLVPQLSPVMSSQALPVGTAQGRGRSCCSLVTEAGSVLAMSRPLTCPPRCHPQRQGFTSAEPSLGMGLFAGSCQALQGRRH